MEVDSKKSSVSFRYQVRPRIVGIAFLGGGVLFLLDGATTCFTVSFEKGLPFIYVSALILLNGLLSLWYWKVCRIELDDTAIYRRTPFSINPSQLLIGDLVSIKSERGCVKAATGNLFKFIEIPSTCERLEVLLSDLVNMSPNVLKSAAVERVVPDQDLNEYSLRGITITKDHVLIAKARSIPQAIQIGWEEVTAVFVVDQAIWSDTGGPYTAFILGKSPARLLSSYQVGYRRFFEFMRAIEACAPSNILIIYPPAVQEALRSKPKAKS